jgi:hypothetical protein
LRTKNDDDDDECNAVDDNNETKAGLDGNENDWQI